MSDRWKPGVGLAKERTGYVAKVWIRRTIDPTTRLENFVMATIVVGGRNGGNFLFTAGKKRFLSNYKSGRVLE